MKKKSFTSTYEIYNLFLQIERQRLAAEAAAAAKAEAKEEIAAAAEAMADAKMDNRSKKNNKKRKDKKSQKGTEKIQKPDPSPDMKQIKNITEKCLSDGIISIKKISKFDKEVKNKEGKIIGCEPPSKYIRQPTLKKLGININENGCYVCGNDPGEGKKFQIQQQSQEDIPIGTIVVFDFYISDQETKPYLGIIIQTNVTENTYTIIFHDGEIRDDINTNIYISKTIINEEDVDLINESISKSKRNNKKVFRKILNNYQIKSIRDKIDEIKNNQ